MLEMVIVWWGGRILKESKPIGIIFNLQLIISINIYEKTTNKNILAAEREHEAF